MKKYFKENQVYSVQEGSVLETQLISDGFEEVVETESQLKGKKNDDG
ncbi:MULTISPECIES: hypothetical protein [Streptococcus]|jgi:hypothetical protein|uniref:Phage protein n=1 Tax=Streptococcus anginosus TaxID=1328 RepID=A0ABT3ECD0_STRAP|nr:MULTISPECIES: hypothetical protein [Bacteria]MBU5589843.1 hypothetical protein [Streptococcus anginosus]MCW0964377.1 hypothetical protein [Streptococcus anginosus]MCW0978720.1 hypothetical protein [Streptococcus anginosus]MCW1042898.1 hypothetical protein [Streptococcus anginosus]MDB8648921.1 hypothetical protein [Streptococcus anginosus]